MQLVELLKIVKLHGEVRPPEGPTNPAAVPQHRAEAQARLELSDESPLQVAFGLDGGHHDRLKARAEQLLTELREPFCDGPNAAGTTLTMEA